MTATAVMAKAQIETAAPTLTPTNTATPSTLGDTVQFTQAKLELSVQWAQTHTQIVPGGRYYYTPATGHMFVELGVLINNTGDKPYICTMNDIRLLNAAGDSRFPGFGALTTVDVGTSVNTAGLKIPADPLKRDQDVTFENGKYTYMRLIFHILKAKQFTFRILNSPPITFMIK